MMKRRFALTLTAVASSTTALAQVPPEGVQMYGVVDVGIHHVSGLKGGSRTDLASGIMEGSRLGFRGTETLKPGWKTIFVAESRLEADNGTLSNQPMSGSQVPDRLNTATALGLPTALQPAVTAVAASLGSTVGVNLDKKFFDRQMFLGLVTPIGAFLGGRQYTPAYEMAANLDTTTTQSALAAGQLASLPAGFDIRVSNALAYRAELGGFSGALMYAFGEVSGKSSAGRLWGINAMYKGQGYKVGAAYNTRNNELGEKSLTSAVLGGAVDVGKGAVSGFVASFKDDHPTGVSTIASTLTAANASLAAVAPTVQAAFTEALKQDSRLLHIGYRFPFGPHPTDALYLSYSRFNDRRPANADTNSYGFAYTHAFSKRTDATFIVARYDNKNWGQAAPGGNGFLGGVTASAGTDANSIALSLRHRF